MRRRSVFLIAWLSVMAVDLHAVEITLGNGSADERQAQAQLERLLSTYELDKWTFTDRVRIDESRWIPHSHPVLTLNPRYLGDDLAQLATYLHEQFHWFANTREDDIAAAIKAFREVFPDVPSGRAGARNEYSTYLHLVICDLELQAMQQLVGDERAREVLAAWQHYTWIYEQVLDNPVIRRINAEHGMLVP